MSEESEKSDRVGCEFTIVGMVSQVLIHIGVGSGGQGGGGDSSPPPPTLLTVYIVNSIAVQSNLDYPNLHYPKPRLSGWGFHLHFHLIRIARVKIQTSGCSILLFLVLLPGAMASIKHKGIVRTTYQ